MDDVTESEYEERYMDILTHPEEDKAIHKNQNEKMYSTLNETKLTKRAMSPQPVSYYEANRLTKGGSKIVSKRRTVSLQNPTEKNKYATLGDEFELLKQSLDPHYDSSHEDIPYKEDSRKHIIKHHDKNTYPILDESQVTKQAMSLQPDSYYEANRLTKGGSKIVSKQITKSVENQTEKNKYATIGDESKFLKQSLDPHYDSSHEDIPDKEDSRKCILRPDDKNTYATLDESQVTKQAMSLQPDSYYEANRLTKGGSKIVSKRRTVSLQNPTEKNRYPTIGDKSASLKPSIIHHYDSSDVEIQNKRDSHNKAIHKNQNENKYRTLNETALTKRGMSPQPGSSKSILKSQLQNMSSTLKDESEITEVKSESKVKKVAFPGEPNYGTFEILTFKTSESFLSEDNLESLDRTLNAHLEHDIRLMNEMKTVDATLKFMDDIIVLIKMIEEKRISGLLGDYEASINIYRFGHDLIFLRKRFSSILDLEFGNENHDIEFKKLEEKYNEAMEKAQVSHLNMDYRTYEELFVLDVKAEDLNDYFDDAYQAFHKGRRVHSKGQLKYYNQPHDYNSACRRLHTFDRIIHKIVTNPEYYIRLKKDSDQPNSNRLDHLQAFINENYYLEELIDEYTVLQKMSINELLDYSKSLFTEHIRIFAKIDMVYFISKKKTNLDKEAEKNLEKDCYDLKKKCNNLRIILELLHQRFDEIFISNYERSIVPDTDVRLAKMFKSEFLGDVMSSDECVIKGVTCPRGIVDFRKKRRDETKENFLIYDPKSDESALQEAKYLEITRKLYITDLAVDKCLILRYPILSDILDEEIMQNMEHERETKGKNTSLSQSPGFIDYLEYTDLEEERKKIRELELFEDYFEYHVRLGHQFRMFSMKKANKQQFDNNYLKRHSNELRILFYEFNKKLSEKIDEAFVERFFETKKISLKFSKHIHVSRNYKAPYMILESEKDDVIDEYASSIVNNIKEGPMKSSTPYKTR